MIVESADLRLLGGTAILLRQVFASVGQGVVGTRALKLLTSGDEWTTQQLGALRLELLDYEPEQVGKRRGRMSAFSGPLWVAGLLAKPGRVKAFHCASEHVGRFLASTIVERSAFHVLCAKLKSSAKLYHLSSYSVPHLVRACCVARETFHGDLVQPCEQAWLYDLRCMHEDNTARIFDLLQVRSMQDAQGMAFTMVGVARSVYSRATARRFSSLSLIDLPCEACEFAGILGSVKQFMQKQAGIRVSGDAHAVDWLLKRLPGKLTSLKEMGRRQRIITQKLSTRGNGLDLQAAGSVTKGWLQEDDDTETRAKGRHKSLHDTCTRGSGDAFGVPNLFCDGCGELILNTLTCRPRSELCAQCLSVARRTSDRLRKQEART